VAHADVAHADVAPTEPAPADPVPVAADQPDTSAPMWDPPAPPLDLVREHSPAFDDRDHLYGDHADLPPASSDAWTV
jgi:hypothetical protein